MRALRKRLAAYTLAEILISGTVAAILSAVLITGAVVIQKNFAATNRYARSVAQQVRLLDYVALDLRRALTVANTQSEITITIPDYYDADGKPRMPTIDRGLIYYGDKTAPKVIRYFKRGAAVIRSDNGTETTIADDVEDFQLSFKNEGQVVELSISFIPTFQQISGGTGNRNGTTFFVRTLLRNKL